MLLDRSLRSRQVVRGQQVGSLIEKHDMRQAGAVDLDDVDDDLEELEFSLSGQARLDAVRARAEAMPVGEPGRAEYLTSLAEFLAMEDRLDDAEAVYREALDDGGPTLLHPLGGLMSVSLQRADDTAVNELNSRLWQLARADQLSDSDYESVADVLEFHGRLREAMRWYTVPLRHLDPEEDIDLMPIVASNGRERVRKALGLPPDRYDEAAPRVREFAKARWDEREPD